MSSVTLLVWPVWKASIKVLSLLKAGNGVDINVRTQFSVRLPFSSVLLPCVFVKVH